MLTDIGQTLLPHIREVLNRVEKIQQEIALTKNIETGLIRIGTFASASACLLPKLLVSYQKNIRKSNLNFMRERMKKYWSGWIQASLMLDLL